MRSLCFFLFIVFTSHLSAQKLERIVLEWNDTYTESLLGIEKMPVFKGADLNPNNDHLPVFFKTVEIGQDFSFDYEVKSMTTMNVDKGFEHSNALHPKFDIKLSKVESRRKFYLNIEILPIAKNISGFKLLSEVELLINIVQHQSAMTNKSINYAAQSVLADGNWHKVSVSANGIYKLDYPFLNDLGVNVAGKSFNEFGVFGNTGAMLPEITDMPRADDLNEQALLHIHDANNNGNFDIDDYVLFYAQGPDQWHFDSLANRYYHTKNIYSNANYYFISSDKGNGKRPTTYASSETSNLTITSYDAYDFYELEDINLIRTGRNWFGDYLSNASRTRNMSLNIPNIVGAEPIHIKSRMAARAGSPSAYNLSLNGNTIATHNIDKVTFGPYDPYAKINELEISTSTNSSTLNFEYELIQNSLAEAWIDYLEVNAKSQLHISGSSLLFRDKRNLGIGNYTQYQISNATNNTKLFDITDAFSPDGCVIHEVSSSINGSILSATVESNVLKEFVAINLNGSDFANPLAIGQVANQDLHQYQFYNPEMLIISHPSLIAEAERLADLHRSKDNMEVLVVTPQLIYNEFSSGKQDVMAIRDFMRLMYKQAVDEDNMIKYLLLFGDGSYDYKDIIENNTNIVPSYQAPNSLASLKSYTSDDFYVLLDDGEGVGTDGTIDVAAGRLPISTIQQAKAVVDKIYGYVDKSSLGDWRLKTLYVADDEDNNIHFRDADLIAEYNRNNHELFNVQKIYLDSYSQVNTSAGDRYPSAKRDFLATIENGSLIVNYTGHGNPGNWTEERILVLSDVLAMENIDRLPLFVTATCEFSRYDDPAVHSAGETLLTHADGGAIGLVTTTRVVFSNQNYQLNSNFVRRVFDVDSSTGLKITVGESMRLAKNAISANDNNRKFNLLGDPALRLAYPDNKVVTTTINGQAAEDFNDTLRALSLVTIEGEVRDPLGNQILVDFNGIVSPTIYDKLVEYSTLKNDPASNVASFVMQNSIIFKGKARVTDGKFSFSFIVPKDINYRVGEGKISYYAESEIKDAGGFDFDLKIGGGTNENAAEDNDGPLVEVFMNDSSFMEGGLTDANPKLFVRLFDEHGINTSGISIGHDISATLDFDDNQKYILNDAYVSELDNYKRGNVLYQLNDLENGIHQVRVEAWDVYNNMGEGFTDFIVASSQEVVIQNLFNYPNPFADYTNFHIEHNLSGESLNVQIDIFDMSGNLVSRFIDTIVPEGYTLDGLGWNGLSSSGAQLNRGMYIYKVTITDESGRSAKEMEKLVLMK